MDAVRTAAAFVRFLVRRKNYWLLPAVVLLLALSLLFALAHGAGPAAPFLYTLF